MRKNGGPGAPGSGLFVMLSQRPFRSGSYAQ
jgi:hypothetical protein